MTGTAAIDPGPMEVAAVENAKIVIADRTDDAPTVEVATSGLKDEILRSSRNFEGGATSDTPSGWGLFG
jgi:hypothetical protein